MRSDPNEIVRTGTTRTFERKTEWGRSSRQVRMIEVATTWERETRFVAKHLPSLIAR